MSNPGPVTAANSSTFASYFSRDNITQAFQNAQTKVRDFTRGIPAQMNQSSAKAAIVIAVANAVFFGVIKYTLIPVLERICPENADDSRFVMIGKEVFKVAVIGAAAVGFNVGLAYVTRYQKLDRVLQLTISILVVFSYVFIKRMPTPAAQRPPETPVEQRARLERTLEEATRNERLAQATVVSIDSRVATAQSARQLAQARLEAANALVTQRVLELRLAEVDVDHQQGARDEAEQTRNERQQDLEQAQGEFTDQLQDDYNAHQAYLQQRQQLEQAVQAAEQAVQAAQRVRNEAQATFDQLGREVDEAHQAKNAYTGGDADETTRLQEAEAELARRRNEAEQELAAAIQTVEQRVQARQAAQQELDNLQVVQENQDATDTHDAVVQAQQALEAAVDALTNAEGRLQELTDERDEAEEALQEARNAVAPAQAVVDQAQQSLIDAQVQLDGEEYTTAATQRSTAHARVEELEREIAALTPPAVPPAGTT